MTDHKQNKLDAFKNLHQKKEAAKRTDPTTIVEQYTYDDSNDKPLHPIDEADYMAKRAVNKRTTSKLDY